MKNIPEYDIWTYLSHTKLPIVMYGMGNGADKILSVCNNLDIEICDFFANDGFVRGHMFHGKTVLTYSQIKEKYTRFIVLLSFATSLDNVLESIKKIDSDPCCELYAPDVPVCGNTLFDMNFYNQHKAEIEKVYSLLCDEKSKEIYCDIISFKLSAKISYLIKHEFSSDELFNSILKLKNCTSYTDLGAYNGDTIKELLTYADKLQKIVAFEPDRRNFAKLASFAETIKAPIIKTYQLGAWDKETTLYFDGSGNRNANLITTDSISGKKLTETHVNSLDNILSGEETDYIKYDVEGAEKEAILGSQKTIANHLPKLNISVYHRSEDIFSLPLMIHEMFPQYKLYLRKKNYIPAWDITLCCTTD